MSSAADGSGRSRRKALIGAGALMLLVLVGAVAAYAVHFSDRALPRTTVGDTPVTGMTRPEVAAALQRDFDAVTVAVRTPDGAAQRQRLADLGYDLDVEPTVAEVFRANRTWTAYVTSLFTPRRVDATLEADPERLEDVADGLVERSGEVGSPARVRQAKDKASFVVVPAVIGQTVVMDSFRDTIEDAGRGLVSTTASVRFVDGTPAVTTAAAQSVADRANALVDRRVSVSDGDTEHAASPKVKASWVTVPSTAEGLGEPSVRAAEVRAWVDSLAEDAAMSPSDGLRNVSSTGRILTVVRAARDGRVVTNAQEVAGEAVGALARGADYAGEFEYDAIPASWTERRVAAGAEHLAYPATEGEKWVDVNLSRHTMTAYVGATVVKGPIAMVNGAPETPTVVGTFRVYHKNPLMTMRGFNADGTRYETPNVPWSSFFHNGYALHGAPWRSSFGYSASHGCVNLPVGVAAWVYRWATIGTPVVTHF